MKDYVVEYYYSATLRSWDKSKHSVKMVDGPYKRLSTARRKAKSFRRTRLIALRKVEDKVVLTKEERPVNQRHMIDDYGPYYARVQIIQRDENGRTLITNSKRKEIK